jgi:hypothetical protein
MDQDDDKTRRLRFSGTPEQIETYRKLMSIALLGAMYALDEDAAIASEALESVMDDTTMYRANFTMAHALGGNAQPAIDEMTRVLAERPDDDFARVVMGTAMLLVDHPDGRFTVDNVLATSMDQRARRTALTVLACAPRLQRRARARMGHGSVRPI